MSSWRKFSGQPGNRHFGIWYVNLGPHRPNHSSGRVGSGSGRVTSGFGSKNIGLRPTRDMVGRVGFGLARIFVCNSWVLSGFLSFGSKISARARLVTWSDWVGSGGPWSGLGPQNTLASLVQSRPKPRAIMWSCSYKWRVTNREWNHFLCLFSLPLWGPRESKGICTCPISMVNWPISCV